MSNVTHPAHYNSGKIEVIEAIEDWKLDYPSGNAVKYIARAGRKNPDKEIEDLEKAVWYLKRKIENLTATKEGRDPIRPNAMNPQSSTSATDASTLVPYGTPTVIAKRAHWATLVRNLFNHWEENPKNLPEFERLAVLHLNASYPVF